MSCAPSQDPDYSQDSVLFPVVTMTTDHFVAATEIQVTVIGLSPGGAQLGTAVINFNGPFAPGQVFTSNRVADMGNISVCEIAAVAADCHFTFQNESPVTGG